MSWQSLLSRCCDQVPCVVVVIDSNELCLFKDFWKYYILKKFERHLFLLSILISAMSKPGSFVVAAADTVASVEFRSVKRISTMLNKSKQWLIIYWQAQAQP